METRYTINQKIALAALTELNNVFFNTSFYDDDGKCIEPLTSTAAIDGDFTWHEWNPAYVERMRNLLKEKLHKYVNITDKFKKAFNEALESDNDTFYENVHYLLCHHFHGMTARQVNEYNVACLQGRGEEKMEEIEKADPNFGKWAENGNTSEWDNLLLCGLMSGKNIFGTGELTEILLIIKQNTEIRREIKCLSMIEKTQAEAPESSTGTTTRQATDEAENRPKNADRHIPVITDEMVKDFAMRFGSDKGDYREILEHIAQLTSSNIGHYLFQCTTKKKQERLNRDLIAKELHRWLQANGFSVSKYRSWLSTFC